MPVRLAQEEAARLCPAGTAGAMPGSPCPALPQPAGEEAKRRARFAKAEPRFAQVSAAGTHLSPRTCSCSPADERVYSRKLLPFILQFAPRAGAGPETCHPVRSPRAGSSPAPSPVTGVVAVSPFYIMAADGERWHRGRRPGPEHPGAERGSGQPCRGRLSVFLASIEGQPGWGGVWSSPRCRAQHQGRNSGRK